MPNTLEDKISLFTKVMIERIEYDFQKKQKELVEHCEKRKANIIENYEERKKIALVKAARNAEFKKQQLILKTRSELHLEILKKRNEFIERIMDDVKKRTNIFIRTTEYKGFLKNAISQVLSKFSDDQYICFSFSRNDIENNRKYILETLKSLKNEGTYEIKDDKSLTGGLFVKSDDGKVEVNFTIDNIVEDSKKLVGQYLSSWLDGEQSND